VDRREAREAKVNPDRGVTLYPIECNPRAHTAVVLFSETPEVVDGYMSVLEECNSRPRAGNCDGTLSPQRVYRRRPADYYCVGHDLLMLVLLPALSLFWV
jgi:catechol O-methyltransferase